MSRRKGAEPDIEPAYQPDPRYARVIAKRRRITVKEMQRRLRLRIYVPEPRGNDDSIYFDRIVPRTTVPHSTSPPATAQAKEPGDGRSVVHVKSD